MRKESKAKKIQGGGPDEYEGLVFIGVIPGRAELATHVTLTLHANGVRCLIEGSHGYPVLVAAEDAERAKEILKVDAKKNNYDIYLEE